MITYNHNKAILLSVVLVVIIGLFYIESASACPACDNCIHNCQDFDNCCTGTGCICEDECNSCPCPDCMEQKWWCGPYGDCSPYCQQVAGPNYPSQLYYFFDLAHAPLNPEFMWDTVSDANSYDVQICADSACSSIVLTASSKINDWQVVSGVSPNATYWFRLRSVNSCGNGSWGWFPSSFNTSSCRYSLSPKANAYGPQGGTGTVNVGCTALCSWTATSNHSWIRITSGSSGFQSGTVSYSVDVNTAGNARTGSITIGGQGLTLRQVASNFVDDPNNMFTLHIYGITTEGITRGCWGDTNYFCPNDVVTRGAMAAFIIRAIYGENFSYTQTPYFTDVPASNGYFKYVQKMKDVGITAVVGTYMVNDAVTRGAMAAFIIRAIYGEDFSYTQTPYFYDVPESNGYFKYVQKMKDEGITGNVGTYNWTDVVIREHMAAFLARAFLGMQ